MSNYCEGKSKNEGTLLIKGRGINTLNRIYRGEDMLLTFYYIIPSTSMHFVCPLANFGISFHGRIQEFDLVPILHCLRNLFIRPLFKAIYFAQVNLASTQTIQLRDFQKPPFISCRYVISNIDHNSNLSRISSTKFSRVESAKGLIEMPRTSYS